MVKLRLRENAELLQAFRRGDRAALEAVYNAYADELLTMLREGFAIESAGKHYLFEGYRDLWQLETAAQEIIARAFAPKARTSYDGLRPYKNYLFTIARNYVVDAFRKKKRFFIPLENAPEQIQEGIEASEENRHGPEASAFSREVDKLVKQFIASLNAFDKRLFDLRFVEGLSVEALARKLGITDYRVKRTEKRIRMRFYRFMREHGYFEGYRYSEIPPKTLPNGGGN